MRSLTIAIPSYQRRDPLLRLLESLDRQSLEAPDDWEGVDVVVVLDGSDDGSKEAVAARPANLPIQVRWQPNQGPAACRNACLEIAGGEIIYFCDDDLIPADGTILKHRRFHEEGPRRILLGPQVIPADLAAPAVVREYWDDLYERLTRDGKVARWVDFSTANSSTPASVFDEVGGFDGRFVGYGLEDHEIGIRILRAGFEQYFDMDAVAWHYTHTDENVLVAHNREIGRNFVRLAQIHPDISDNWPNGYTGRALWTLDHLPIYDPASWAAISKWSARSAELARQRWPVLSKKFLNLALISSYASGVADQDPGLLPRVFGRPRPVGITAQDCD